jgi:hypothetical protein
MSPPLGIAVGAEVFPILSSLSAAVRRPQGGMPDDNLGLDDYNVEDDPLALAVPTAGDLLRPSLPGVNGIPSRTHTFLQLARYLVRPQLLTRL